MKTTNITYWISTSLTAALFAFSSVLYLTHNPQLVNGFKMLGYPEYLLTLLGIAKILAAIALLVPRFPRLKEWAYAGLAFDLIGALWSHMAIGDSASAPSVLVFVVLLATSYLSYHKRLENKSIEKVIEDKYQIIKAKN